MPGCRLATGLFHARTGRAAQPKPSPYQSRCEPACTASDSHAMCRTGSAVEYLICSIAKLELTSYNGTAPINSL
jgi:hypothetical protein